MNKKEKLEQTIYRFIEEYGRYPNKHDYSKTDYLYGRSTYLRHLGIKANWSYLEKVYKGNPKRCLHCGKNILFEKRVNKFCNHSCSASFNNKRTKRKPTSKGIGNKKEYNSCLCCGKTINYKRVFCSIECEMEFKFHERIENYFCGKTLGHRALKKILKYYHGNKCSVCGITDWNGKEIVLELDHIDGNSEDNSWDNLRLICPNCHSQTDTYKSKNTGNGRHCRRQRYRDGKSY